MARLAGGAGRSRRSRTTRRLALFVAPALLLAAGGAALAPGFVGDAARVPKRGASIDPATLRPTFADEFDTLSLQADGGRWRTTYAYGGIAARTLTSNGEKQLYVDPGFRGSADAPLRMNPFRIDRGVLGITAARVDEATAAKMWGYRYASGLLTTKGTFAQRYGYFEIRAKLPAGQGLWPAFWLLSADGTWPPELDVIEHLGRDPDTVYMSTVFGRSQDARTHEKVNVPGATTAFHTYGMRWDKTEVAFYVDRSEVGRVPTPASMHKPMYLLVNLAVGGGWARDPDPAKPFGGTYAIDYVRAYAVEDTTTLR